MKLETGALRLSATDLANHLACRHLTSLDRGVAEGRWKPPDWFRPEAAVLRERGLEHERAYLAHLEQQGRRITRLDEGPEGARGLEQTIVAMREGAEVIAQATLAGGRWLRAGDPGGKNSPGPLPRDRAGHGGGDAGEGRASGAN